METDERLALFVAREGRRAGPLELDDLLLLRALTGVASFGQVVGGTLAPGLQAAGGRSPRSDRATAPGSTRPARGGSDPAGAGRPGGVLSLVVANASALLEYLLVTEAMEPIRTVLRRAEIDVHVPALCDVEVVAGLRRATRLRILTIERAREPVNDYLDLPLTRHGHQGLLGRILGLLDTFSPYDATYVALAERLGAQLLTADEPLAAATRTHTTIGVLPGRRVCSIPSRQPPDGHGRVMDRLRGTSPKILSLSYLGC